MKAMLALMLVAPLAACATMARGMSQNIDITSEPPGAKVETSLGKGCEATPCTLEKVSREARFTITVSKPGFQTATQQITHHTSPEGAAAVAASFAIPGGILWSLIDANFGASQDLTPNPVKVTLQPEGAPAAKPAG